MTATSWPLGPSYALSAHAREEVPLGVLEDLVGEHTGYDFPAWGVAGVGADHLVAVVGERPCHPVDEAHQSSVGVVYVLLVQRAACCAQQLAARAVLVVGVRAFGDAAGVIVADRRPRAVDGQRRLLVAVCTIAVVQSARVTRVALDDAEHRAFLAVLLANEVSRNRFRLRPYHTTGRRGPSG